MQNKVKEQFKLVEQEVVKRHGRGRWVEVSAVGTIEEVEEVVRSELDGVFSASPEPLQHLWV
jgi:dTMP kinase